MRCLVLVFLVGLAGLARAQDSMNIEVDPRIRDTIYFARNSSALTPEAQSTLREQADWLKIYTTVTCALEGHTDDWGGREQNRKIGQKRAEAARRFLISLGIAAERLTTISYGEERPAARCGKEQCRAYNRRVTTIVTGGTEPQ